MDTAAGVKMEERPLLRQLLESDDETGRPLGERLGFGDVLWGRLDLVVVSMVALVGQVILVPAGYMGAAQLFAPAYQVSSVGFFASVLISYAVLMAAVWLVGVRRHGGSGADLGFRPLDARGLAGLLAALAATVAAANIVVGMATELPRTQDLFRFGDSPIDIFLLALLVTIAAPLAEETFFRGFLLQGLARRFSFWPAAVLTSAAFALAHVWWQLYLPIFVLGLAFAWLFWRTGSLWAPIAAHATINATSLVVALTIGR